ncbi:hypothetical protein I5L01_13705 [Erythrobacter sp. YJ-T3-07]|uniref:DUF6491 family protein n=1 Tax=Erythrobacter sp. YJ-T3-07 TaxID=2793063 RepID=UPI0018D37824|nr:DUF6491 family protein [Erythrobacter sp. YJ-T3-07]MBH1945279.1 hypothetical protein [Erythrobacter sp. YJ-T3-07]
MRPLLAASTPIIAAVALASCTPTPAPETAQGAPPDAMLAGLDTSRQCFFLRTVDRYSRAPDADGGNARILVRAGGNERFLLESVSSCPEIDFTFKLALDNRFGPTLCTGDTADLLVPSASGTDSCMVRVIGRMQE